MYVEHDGMTMAMMTRGGEGRAKARRRRGQRSKQSQGPEKHDGASRGGAPGW